MGNKSDHGQGYNVVMKLMRGLFFESHRLFIDNFCLSIQLFVDLDTRDMYAVGTVLKNKKLLPKAIHGADVKHMQRGDNIFRRSLFLVCVTRRGTRDVTLLSSCHSATGNNTVTHHSKENSAHVSLQVPVPLGLIDSNKSMGGVNRNDQFCTCYSVKRKPRNGGKFFFFWMH